MRAKCINPEILRNLKSLENNYIREAFEKKTKEEAREELNRTEWDEELINQLVNKKNTDHLGADILAHVDFGPWKDIDLYGWWDLNAPEFETYLCITSKEQDAKREKEFYEYYKDILIKKVNSDKYLSTIRGSVGNERFYKEGKSIKFPLQK